MSTKKAKAPLAPQVTATQIMLTPSMIVGAVDKHISEFLTAIRQNEVMALDAKGCMRHLEQVRPLLESLAHTQDQIRQQQIAAAQAKQAQQNAGASEARN